MSLVPVPVRVLDLLCRRRCGPSLKSKQDFCLNRIESGSYNVNKAWLLSVSVRELELELELETKVAMAAVKVN